MLNSEKLFYLRNLNYLKVDINLLNYIILPLIQFMILVLLRLSQIPISKEVSKRSFLYPGLINKITVLVVRFRKSSIYAEFIFEERNLFDLIIRTRRIFN